jgi:hypothetical protein
LLSVGISLYCIPTYLFKALSVRPGKNCCYTPAGKTSDEVIKQLAVAAQQLDEETRDKVFST